MNKVIGRVYLFTYPSAYTTLPDHRAHSGQMVTVIREAACPDEYDYEGDCMYIVKALDGWQGSVWESELT